MNDDEIEFTIGICAYNEAANIGNSIESALNQKLSGFVLKKIIVVSSASTDDTDSIVRSKVEEHPIVELLTQEKREGKNSAINLILNTKTTEIIVILNADNTLREDSLQNLLTPFRDPKTGIVGGHPIPMNTTKTIAGFASTLDWTTHHHVAMVYPKIGELIAYRDIGTRLTLDTQSDEDLIRMSIEDAGYKSVYAPDAIVYNRGPETIQDFIKQRVRVNIGQSYLIKSGRYYNPTRDSKVLYGALLASVKDLGFHPFKLFISVALEQYCRTKAKLYVKANRGDMNVWDPVSSTKKL